MVNTQIEGCILKTTTGSRSRGKSGVAKALSLIGGHYVDQLYFLFKFVSQKNVNIQFHLHLS